MAVVQLAPIYTSQITSTPSEEDRAMAETGMNGDDDPKVKRMQTEIDRHQVQVLGMHLAGIQRELVELQRQISELRDIVTEIRSLLTVRAG